MKRDWTSQTGLLIIGAILLVVNLIGLNLFGRLDLTDDRVYSLSDASIDIVENLEDPVTITAYFSEGLPAPYSSNRRFLKDKLDDYRAYGGQNIQYRFVDPLADEDLRNEANRYQIPPIQIQVIESDNVQLKNAYMGVAIEYGGEREVIPVVQDLSSLEYDITGAVRRLTREALPVVGVLSGHGEPPLAQAMPTLQQELQRNYTVHTVTIQDSVLSTRPEALLVIAPTDTLPPEHLRALDDYLMTGGRMAFLLNRVEANLQAGQASVQKVGLEPLLETYGAALIDNLVMDQQSSMVTVQRRQGFFNIAQQIEYPFLPIASRFNPNNIMVNRLNNVMFHFVSAVDTSKTLPEGVALEPLILSSPRSSTQQGFFMIQPMPDRPPLSGGPYVLAAAYTGTFPSAYTPGRTSLPSRLVLVGDGDLLNEQVLGQALPGNIGFALNMVDWLVQDDALLTIRTKSIAPRTLSDVSDAAKPWIKYGNMLLPTLIIIAFGLARWRRRKHQVIVLNT